ncbi:hypothetical protein R3P38DRAFT_3027252 [Favolaschia claudopus]|uniref:Protein TSSC4 n=1 Tax=Favolaschia claudopus TaxID=2862362 RepID=A0AAW0AFM4_9AGAR
MEDVSDSSDVWGIRDVQMPPVQAQEVSDPQFPGPSSFYVPSLDELNEELERFLPSTYLKRKGDTLDSPTKKLRPSPASPTAPRISDGFDGDSDSEEDSDPPPSKSAGKQRSSLSVEIDACIKSILDRLADEGQQREASQAKHAESVARAKLDGSFDPLDDDDAFYQPSEASNWHDLSEGLDELFKLMDLDMNTKSTRVSHHVGSDDDASNSHLGSSTGHRAHTPKASSSIVGDREQDARLSANTKPYLNSDATPPAGSVLSRPENDAEMLGHADLFDYDERDRTENRCPCLKCHPIPGLKFDPNDPDLMPQQEVHRLFAQSLFANPSDSDSLDSSDG